MMSPLEYLFVMMMKTKQPDDAAMSRVEPAAGQATIGNNAVMVSRNGHLEMRTILMEPRDHTSEKLEAPLMIRPEWEPLFKIGAPLVIKVDKGQQYRARVTRIETIRDDSGQSIQAIAELGSHDTSLQPGQTATAVFDPAPLNN